MSRTWKWVLGIAAALVIAGVLVAIFFITQFTGAGHSVDAEIARIKAEGGPTTAADLAGKSIPDSENAAVVYEKCFAHLSESWSSSPEGKVLGDFLDSGKRATDPRLWSQARMIVARYEKALVLADKASGMPRCRFHVEWKKPFEYKCPHHLHLGFLASMFRTRALVLAKDGDTAGALRSVESILALSNALKREPAAIAAIRRWSIIVIAGFALKDVCEVGRVKEAQARHLSDRIGSITLSGSAATALQGERVLGIVGFDEIRHGRFPYISGDTKAADAVMRLYSRPSSRAVLNLDEAVYLREMRAGIADASLPYRLIPLSTRSGDKPALPKHALFSSILLPMLDGSENRRQDRAIANLAGSRIFLGLLAYRDRFGSYPPSLGDLKRLNWQLPEDPFSGKPFVYHHKGSGFLLYSIDDDLKDNGGVERNVDKPGDIVWGLDR